MNTEFSRPIKARHIHEDVQTHEIIADEAARAALAARFGLPGIAHLRGVFTLWHERGGIIAAKLSMQARVTQTCVVTLEPFGAKLAEESDLRFVPAREEVKEGEEEEDVTPESLDGPDEIPYTNEIIDLGEALAEQLALALDPYPRKPGAKLPDEAVDDSANPFALLKGKFGKQV